MGAPSASANGTDVPAASAPNSSADAGMSSRRIHDAILSDSPLGSMVGVTPDVYRSDTSLRNSRAIVLDLGTHYARAGFSASKKPVLSFPPVVARVRDPARPSVRNAIGYDALGTSLRSAARAAYEGGIPANPALVERLLDNTLLALGLAEEPRIEHKFVVTEPPCQPNAARGMYMEVLMEGYGATGVVFGIDALFSYLYNRHLRDDWGVRLSKREAVVISCAHASTHVLPVHAGRFHAPAAKRINIGGMHMTAHFARRLQLQNPDHSSLLTVPRVERLKEELCYVSQDYDAELANIRDCVDVYNKTLKIVKVPFAELNDKPQVSEEEQERIRKAKIENGKRLSEMMKDRRRAKGSTNSAKGASAPETESIKYTEEEVAPLYALLSSRYKLQRIQEMKLRNEEDFYLALLAAKFENVDALHTELQKREEAVFAEREKIGEAKADYAESAWWKKLFEDELMTVSDNELSAANVKKKRHIKALRGAAEARLRARKEREAERALAEERAARLKREREEDPEGYLAKLRIERDRIAERMKRRAAAKQAASDRRSQAGRERMRLLAEHAGREGADEDTTGSGRGGRGKRGGRGRGRGRGGAGRGGISKKGKTSKKRVSEQPDEDTFGMNDSDWDVYKDMQVGKGGDESDGFSAADEEQLRTLRKEIEALAPDEDDPTLVRAEGSALLYMPHAHADEIPIVVDRISVPEMIFQPGLVGLEQCGLIEALQTSIRGFDEATRRSIVSEVFISGGVGSTRGFEERMRRDIISAFPAAWRDDIRRGIRVAHDPVLDAWRGAALFAEQGKWRFDKACISREDFLEKGADYIHEHDLGNWYVPTPIVDVSLLDPKKKKYKTSVPGLQTSMAPTVSAARRFY